MVIGLGMRLVYTHTKTSAWLPLSLSMCSSEQGLCHAHHLGKACIQLLSYSYAKNSLFAALELYYLGCQLSDSSWHITCLELLLNCQCYFMFYGCGQRRYDMVTSLQGLKTCVECNYCRQVQLFSVLEAFYFQFSLRPAQALFLWMLSVQSSNSSTKISRV